ncbi:MAG: Ig-like domain-containing protein, partial [Bacillota bacterium]|nr:Ig-like domain-containing protein [Bacillota bacterium]
MRKVLSFLMAVIFLFSGIPSYAITEGNNLEIVVNQGYDLYVDADSNDDSESNHNNFPNIDNYNFNSLNNDSIIAAKAFDKDNSEGIIAGFNLSTTTGESSSNSWYVYKEQSQPGKYESKKWFERGYRSNNWAHATEIDIGVYSTQGWPEVSGGSWIWSEKYGDGGGGLDSPIYLRNKILGIIEIGNQSLTTPEDTPIDITIPYEDVYGNEWKIILSNPSNGSVVNNGIGSLTYTPDLNFNGNDLFTVEVEDIDGLTDTATISIEVTPVDDDPKANDDNEVTDEETPVTIDVLVNDTDVDGGDKYIDSFEQGSNGSVTQSINELIYTPNVDFYGDDSFTYSLNGGSAATVYITVNNVDDPPTAIVDTEVTNEDTPITISVLDNDLNEDDGLIEIIDFSHGSIGTVTQSGDDLVYTPNLNENGNDTFTYTLNGGSSTTVNMTINAINDDPVAINDMVSTTLNTSVSVPVLDNDEDVEGDPINITSFGQGSYGDVVRDGVELVYTPKLVYTPNNEYVESDSFIYEINNISTATVTVVVDNSVPPSANNDAVETDEE